MKRAFLLIGVILVLSGCGEKIVQMPPASGAPYVRAVVPDVGVAPTLILPDQIVTVRFDRPMKHEEREYLKITPMVNGRYEWVNPDALQFVPEAWPMATTFIIEVPAGILAEDGGATEQAFTFQLATPEPRVMKVLPSMDELWPLDQTITIQFNQSMELGEIRPGENVQLFPSNDLDSNWRIRKDGFYNVEVVYAKNEQGGEDRSTLLFKPTFPYQKNREYRLLIKQGLRGAAAKGDYGRKGLEKDFEMRFRTGK